MKQFQFCIFLAFSILISQYIFAQSLTDFSDVLNERKIGKVITKIVGKDISQRTYLGTIKDNKGNTKYYVVKEFLRIQAAIVYHGHSKILFFDNKKVLVKQALLSMPDELPFKLKDNILYFHNSAFGSKPFMQDVNDLPKMLCVEPTSCYPISKP